MHIIPAAGSATRMKGIPKYLLPVGLDSKPLIFHHLEAALEANLRDVFVAIAPTMQEYMKELLKDFKESVHLLPIQSISLSDTLIQSYEFSKSQNREEVVSVSLPDTYNSGFLDRSFVEALVKVRSYSRGLMLWKIAINQKGKMGQVDFDLKNFQAKDIVDKDLNCDYEHIWGAFSLLGSDIQKLNIKNATVGDDINSMIHSGHRFHCEVVNGRIFDCGTITEYVETLRDTM